MSNLNNTDIKQLLDDCAKQLKQNAIESSRLDAEVLLAHVLQKSREFILAHPQEKLSSLQIKNYKLKIKRRSLGEPIAYIIGHKEFYGLDFMVNKNVLIPRPETELLVECAIKNVRTYVRTKKIIVIDVGTGSGNIIISIADCFKDSLPAGNQNNSNFRVGLIAIENSQKALGVAKQNAAENGVEEYITFLKGRYLNPVIQDPEVLAKAWRSKGILDEKYHFLILANLPYLSEMIYNSAPVSVRNYEPKDSLLSGLDGLDDYRKLLNQIKVFTGLYGFPATVMLEISPEQKTPITKDIKSRFPKIKIKFFKDLAGKSRLVSFEI